MPFPLAILKRSSKLYSFGIKLLISDRYTSRSLPHFGSRVSQMMVSRDIQIGWHRHMQQKRTQTVGLKKSGISLLFHHRIDVQLSSSTYTETVRSTSSTSSMGNPQTSTTLFLMPSFVPTTHVCLISRLPTRIANPKRS